MFQQSLNWILFSTYLIKCVLIYCFFSPGHNCIRITRQRKSFHRYELRRQQRRQQRSAHRFRLVPAYRHVSISGYHYTDLLHRRDACSVGQHQAACSHDSIQVTASAFNDQYPSGYYLRR